MTEELEWQGPTQSVCFSEVSVFLKVSVKRESTVIIENRLKTKVSDRYIVFYTVVKVIKYAVT